MSQELVLVVIGLLVAGVVFGPMLRDRVKPAARESSKRTRAPLVRGNDGASSADELAELELDHEMGRVSDEDYARWRGEIASGAAPVESGRPLAAGGSRESAEALVRRYRDAPRSRCPNCGDRPEPDARYCSNCGTALA